MKEEPEERTFKVKYVKMSSSFYALISFIIHEKPTESLGF